MPETNDELRERLALLQQIAALEGGAAPEPEEDEIAEGELLIVRELLGEFRKQQIVQDTEDPETDPEHFGLAAVLPQHLVAMLEDEGWIDPCPRDWKMPAVPVAPVVSRETKPVKVARAGLKKLAGPPPSLFEEIGARTPETDLATLVEREVQRRQAEMQAAMVAGQHLFDDDMPEELRQPGYAQQMPKRPKAKKPKKAKAPKDQEPAQRYYADGTPVEPAGATSPQLAVVPAAAPTAAVLQPGWTRDAAGQLIAPPRVPVKAVYPPVRGTAGGKKLPKAIAMGGMTTTEKLVRDGSGRKVPESQANE